MKNPEDSERHYVKNSEDSRFKSTLARYIKNPEY